MKSKKEELLEEGKLNIYYHLCVAPNESLIDTFFEKWIRVALKAFGYEQIGTKMCEDGTRGLLFDKMTRNR